MVSEDVTSSEIDNLEMMLSRLLLPNLPVLANLHVVLLFSIIDLSIGLHYLCDVFHLTLENFIWIGLRSTAVLLLAEAHSGIREAADHSDDEFFVVFVFVLIFMDVIFSWDTYAVHPSQTPKRQLL